MLGISGAQASEGMSIWFAEMSLHGLLFHPEEAPRDIITITTNERTFTPEECGKLDGIMAEMFAMFGDGVYETAYPIFMNCVGWRQAA